MFIMNINLNWIETLSGDYGGAWKQRLPRWATLVLGALLAWLVVRFFWLLVAGPTVEISQISQSMSQSSPDRLGSAQALPNTDWDLLFDQSKTQNNLDIAALPMDQSSLTLVGVVLGLSEEQGFAIIRGSGRKDEVYRLNDTLPDGRMLSQLSRDRVVLSRAGRREVLMLSDRQATQNTVRSSDNERPKSEGLGHQLLQAQGAAGIGIASLGSIRSQILGSASNQMVGDVQLIPVSSGGVRLRPSREATWFAAAGLQAGDVLMAVNGQPVSSVIQSSADLESWVGRVAQGERISLTIQRGSQSVTLQPSLQSMQDLIKERMQQ